MNSSQSSSRAGCHRSLDALTELEIPAPLAQILMSTAEEAQQAVSQLNDRARDGRSLKVEVAKPKGDIPTEI